MPPPAGGVEVASPWPLDDLRARNIDTTEIHLSQTSGFLPDASTLREIIRANRQDLHGLDPATTYYLRTRFRDRFGNASPWSSQSSVTPRYMLNVPAAHIHLSADQTIASSGVATVVQFNDEEYDTRGSYNSASYKFVAPVSGIYLVTCQLTVETLKSNERARVDLYLDGGSPTLLAQGANMEGDDQTYIAHPFINVAYHLDAGDEVDARVTVTNASSVVKNGEQSHITYVLVSQDDP